MLLEKEGINLFRIKILSFEYVTLLKEKKDDVK